MPYIKQEYRPKLDQLSLQLCECLRHSKPQLLSALWQLCESIYGTLHLNDGTRYFKQNELLGVLNCARFEWIRRKALKISAERTGERLSIAAFDLPPELTAIVQKISQEILSNNNEQRPGALNYFLTVTFINLERAGVISASDVPQLLQEFAEAWYSEVTAPYEDTAIETNGDCF